MNGAKARQTMTRGKAEKGRSENKGTSDDAIKENRNARHYLADSFGGAKSTPSEKAGKGPRKDKRRGGGNFGENQAAFGGASERGGDMFGTPGGKRKS